MTEQIWDGLWPWYRDRFYGLGDDDEFEWRRLLGLLTSWQQLYNSMAERPCQGLAFMNFGGKRPVNRCYNPMCPSCWHVRHSELYQRLCQMPEEGHYYFRLTDEVVWHQDIHPRVVQRFKGAHTEYKTICHAIDFDAASEEVTQEVKSWDPFNGEMVYRIMGLFQTPRRMRGYQLDRGQIDVRDPRDRQSGVVGTVDQRYHDIARTALEQWYDTLHHPWQWCRHPSFDSYINRFEQYRPTGKSWVRINQQT